MFPGESRGPGRSQADAALWRPGPRLSPGDSHLLGRLAAGAHPTSLASKLASFVAPPLKGRGW